MRREGEERERRRGEEEEGDVEPTAKMGKCEETQEPMSGDLGS